MSKEKYQPCQVCGSTIDEYLFDYADLETLEVEEVCLKCLKSKRQFDEMKKEYLKGE